MLEDQIPVGIMREREPAGRRSRYDVLGLAVAVRWYDGYFLFASTGPNGTLPGDTLAEVLEARTEADADGIRARLRGDRPSSASRRRR
jgi:hypothetical protein